VVDVAMESGYQSSSVFSELFKRHLGVSPGKWRRKGLKFKTASRIRA
jgi:AraC-like DNA-binding protein